MARHRAPTTSPFWALPAILIPLGVAGAGWMSHVSAEGRVVAPNVEFAGLDVTGMPPETVAYQVETRQVEVLATPITIDLGESKVVLPAAELGFSYGYEETLSSLVAARHGPSPLSEFASWVTTPFMTHQVEDVVHFDAATARERLERDDLVIDEPVEPSIVEEAGTLRLVPGHIGTGIDVESLVDQLESAPIATGPHRFVAAHVDLVPKVHDSHVASLVDELNEKTAPGMLTVVRNQSARVSAATIRKHLVSEVSAGSFVVTIDTEALRREIEEIFYKPVGDFVPPRLVVEDGEVRTMAMGQPPPICCSAGSVEAAALDMINGGSAFYLLDPRPDDDESILAWADGSQVREEVAKFTTNHPCCESRVVNIHTMADMLRGVYLVPGESLSLNEFVGERTRDKGFVPAGAIRRGHMVDEVGGGVSQFVTTIFNAAYLAGLDLDEYQSHSIYFSRYPFGREATISIPGPDLVMTNTTDYPILIWPTYDDRSITVTIYSTPHLQVTELEQRITKRRLCTHVETDRQRIYPDGRVVVDTIEANYRPAEGIDCNGRVIPEL